MARSGSDYILIPNDDSSVAISVSNLHKSFRLPTERAFGLKQAIFNRLKGIKGVCGMAHHGAQLNT